MSYANDVANLAPPYQQGPNMRALYGAIGGQLDASAAKILDGRRQAIVFAGGADASRSGAARLADGRLLECDAWVLPIHAAQRGIALYPTEGELSQRIRLSQWRQLHQQRGTIRGQLLHVRPYFADGVVLGEGIPFPVLRVVHQDTTGACDWHTLDADGIYSVKQAHNFDFDTRLSRRSRYWVFLELQGTEFSAPTVYDGGTKYDDGSKYDQGIVNPFTAAMAADVVQMFVDWQGAMTWLAGVILVWGSPIDVTASPVQDATGWWSLPAGKWGSLVDPTTGRGTRPPTMTWIYDSPAP